MYVNAPGLNDVKKAGRNLGEREIVRYYNRDGSNQIDFLNHLEMYGAKGAFDDLEDIIDYEYEKQHNGEKMPGKKPNSDQIRYVPSVLPCLNNKDNYFDQWLKDQDDTGMPFARSFAID